MSRIGTAGVEKSDPHPTASLTPQIQPKLRNNKTLSCKQEDQLGLYQNIGRNPRCEETAQEAIPRMISTVHHNSLILRRGIAWMAVRSF